jgi:hypothetical protein
MDLAIELQKIYDSEINVEIAWLWDGGIDVALGRQDERLPGRTERKGGIRDCPWLQEAIAHFYPSSEYATALDPEVRLRAANSMFTPPRIGERVFCPYCGAPNPGPGFDEVMAFYCSRCGNSVQVERPPVN